MLADAGGDRFAIKPFERQGNGTFSEKKIYHYSSDTDYFFKILLPTCYGAFVLVARSICKDLFIMKSIKTEENIKI